MVGQGLSLGASQRRHLSWVWKGGKCPTIWLFFFHLTLYFREFFHVTSYSLKNCSCCVNSQQVDLSFCIIIILFVLFVCANWLCYWTINGNRAMRIREEIDGQPSWGPCWSGPVWIMLLNSGFHILTGMLLLCRWPEVQKTLWTVVQHFSQRKSRPRRVFQELPWAGGIRLVLLQC